MPDARTLARVLCETLDPDELEILREDPFEAIPLIECDVTIKLVAYEPGEGCSVEGVYYEPTRSITVQAARSPRRTRFTAIHEFGHDRCRHVMEVARHLAAFSEAASRREEERIADAFAGAVLIPTMSSTRSSTAASQLRIISSSCSTTLGPEGLGRRVV